MRKAKLTSLFAFLGLTLFLSCSPADPPQTQVPVAAEQEPDLQPAAVAMPDRYGAVVAERILRAGGNAVDASIAAGLALAVTYPEAGNIGGGGFMLIRMNGENAFLDYREMAPAAADRDMYLDVDGNVIDGLSLVGHLSVGVPGTVAGFWEAHRRFGSLPWRDLVMPAVELAEVGFEVPEHLGGGMLTELERYEGKTNFGIYFGSMASGEVHKQPELAATLKRIAESGVDDFY
ncbi:MAG: gamma-glutamyltransferase, partial [Gammaproteobacteria bacterium]|nr:gamma-glutamyltransferase [Gammaproteobacteria bacterium]